MWERAFVIAFGRAGIGGAGVSSELIGQLRPFAEDNLRPGGFFWLIWGLELENAEPSLEAGSLLPGQGLSKCQAVIIALVLKEA